MNKSLLFALAFAAPAAFANVTITMHSVDEKGVGAAVGQVIVTESKHGLVFTPNLKGLPPGAHGFHVHQNGSCDSAEKDGQIIPAGAAGGHYDPAGTNAHGTPWGKGHLGDLPPLYVQNDGSAIQPVLAPRLKLEDIKGKSLMIHAGGDNHSDHPAPLGGGGARVTCGVIK
ncbi:MAG: superoxide dismutase [Cu-Zn] SodC [Cellvibrio sp.]|uniref:superoxide dismutase [Cu-Zn] SodC n=1 Tax=Cellvibrio sp. TaxID=1965322 RepID=UPI0031A1EDB8